MEAVATSVTVAEYTAVATRTAFTVSVVQKVVLSVQWSVDLEDSSSTVFQEQAALISNAYLTSSAVTSKTYLYSFEFSNWTFVL